MVSPPSLTAVRADITPDESPPAAKKPKLDAVAKSLSSLDQAIEQLQGIRQTIATEGRSTTALNRAITTAAAAADKAAAAALEAFADDDDESPEPHQHQLSTIPTILVELEAKPLAANFAWMAPDGISAAKLELHRICTPEIALDCLRAMANGIEASRANPAIPPAQTNDMGCWLAQKKPPANRRHVHMPPILPRMKTRAPSGAGRAAHRRKEQFVHRLAIRAWGTMEQVLEMIETDKQVSHLCHNGNCFKPEHLVLETSRANDARDRCGVKKGEGVCTCGQVPSCLQIL